MRACTHKMAKTTLVAASLLFNVQIFAQEPVVAKRLAREREAAQPGDSAAQQAFERELAKQLQSATVTANLQPAAGSTVITAPAGCRQHCHHSTSRLQAKTGYSAGANSARSSADE